MGLKRNIDLETFTGRERARDIIGRMPNLSRHDIYGGMPGFDSGGMSPDFGFSGYDPGCGDCLPECPDKSLRGCAWPHGQVYWTGDSDGDGPAHSFSYVHSYHRSGDPDHFEERLRVAEIRPDDSITTPEGFFTFPGGVSTPYPGGWVFQALYSLTGRWKTPTENSLDPWHDILEPGPWGSFTALLQQHAFADEDDNFIVSIPPPTPIPRLVLPAPIALLSTVQPEVGFDVNAPERVSGQSVGTSRQALSIHASILDDYDFSAPGPGVLDGYSLEFEIQVLSKVWVTGLASVALDMRYYLGDARGCTPPPGVVLEATRWVRNSSGEYEAPTASARPLAVYYDGLLAIPALHYTVVDGKIVPLTVLAVGTKVLVSYVADGGDF